MDEDNLGAVIFVIAIIIIAGIFFAGWGWSYSHYGEDFQDEAVKHGHAKYVLNKKHERQFGWLDHQCPK